MSARSVADVVQQLLDRAARAGKTSPALKKETVDLLAEYKHVGAELLSVRDELWQLLGHSQAYKPGDLDRLGSVPSRGERHSPASPRQRSVRS